MKSIKIYRRFKRKHKVLHTFIVAVAVVLFWRGAWGIIDVYFLPGNVLASNLGSILTAFLILYLDDFHLKELE